MKIKTRNKTNKGTIRYNGQIDKAYQYKSNRMIYGIGSKIVAMILMVISLFMVAGGLFSGMILLEYQAYTTSKDKFVEQFYESSSWSASYDVLCTYYVNEGDNKMDELAKEVNYAGKIIEDGIEICSFGDFSKSFSAEFNHWYRLEHYFADTEEHKIGESAEVYLYVYEELPVVDNFSFINQVTSLAYELRYGVWIISSIALLVAIGMFVFLLSVAGHTRGSEDVIPWGVDRIPTDLYSGLIFLGMFIIAWFGLMFVSSWYSNYIIMGILALVCVLEAVIGTLYCMSLAVRVKARTIFSNTICYKLFSFVGKCMKNSWVMLGLGMGNRPLMMKILPIYVFCSFLGFYGIFVRDDMMRLLLWLFGNGIAFSVTIYICMAIGQVKKGARNMAEGNLEEQVDTKYLVLDFATIGNDMNAIAEGMSIAVEERMKSERFKTELITNVGHDLKTPLTSIINYTDLIQKEETENQKIVEYTAILKKQSERLKRLIIDLVEASKASTGNIDVHLAPCDVGVLLSQAIGEYEHKLTASQLVPITRQLEESVSILADGRLLWRVFDNLLNNICKYAQEGTRVYIDVEKHTDEVRIEFKNISKYELNISEAELMERFVRGDQSRHSEGNGLGLSIAKSLVEVQGGRLSLAIDGDLFKAILIF